MRIFVFSFLVALVHLVSLYVSLLLAAVLMPADLVYQAVFAVSVFLIASSLATNLLFEKFTGRSERGISIFKFKLITGTVIANIILVPFAMSLVFLGFTIAVESLVFYFLLMIISVGFLQLWIKWN